MHTPHDSWLLKIIILHTPHWSHEDQFSVGFVFIWFEILIFKISKFMRMDGFLFVELTALKGYI